MPKHKIVSFLLALIVSVGLWVYAVTVVNPDDTTVVRDIRVRITGTKELAMNNLVLTGGEEQYIDVEVSGRRSDLKELNSSNLEAIADVSNIEAPGKYQVSWRLNPPASVASGDIKLVRSSSNKISVKVSEYKERPEIPVVVEYTGAIATGYIRDPATLNIESIAVSGPVEEVGEIAMARVTVDLQDSKESLDQELAYEFINSKGEVLQMSNYVTVSEPTVRVIVPVMRYKQVKLALSFLPGAGATAEDVEYKIEPASIGVTGSEEALDALDTLIIREVDLSQVTQNIEFTVVPELPTGVINRADDKNVKVTIQFIGLNTRKINIDCSRIERLNDDETLDFGEGSVTITVRGRASDVNSLTAASVRITADMKNDYDPTTMTVKLKVSLVGGSKCGVLGEYTVQVIEKIEETQDDETNRNGG